MSAPRIIIPRGTLAEWLEDIASCACLIAFLGTLLFLASAAADAPPLPLEQETAR